MRWSLMLIAALAACGRINIDDVPDRDAGPADAYVDPCGPTLLLDDRFEDTMAGPTFRATMDTGLTLVESGGHLDVVYAATVVAASYAQYRSILAFTTEGLCAEVEISQVASARAATYLKLNTAAMEVEFFSYDTMVEVRTKAAETIEVPHRFSLDLATHRFWRLRHQAGTTFWETSPDRMAYTVHYAATGFFTVMTTQLEFGAGAFEPATDGGIARFESALIRGP